MVVVVVGFCCLRPRTPLLLVVVGFCCLRPRTPLLLVVVGFCCLRKGVLWTLEWWVLLVLLMVVQAVVVDRQTTLECWVLLDTLAIVEVSTTVDLRTIVVAVLTPVVCGQTQPVLIVADPVRWSTPQTIDRVYY